MRHVKAVIVFDAASHVCCVQTFSETSLPRHRSHNVRTPLRPQPRRMGALPNDPKSARVEVALNRMCGRGDAIEMDLWFGIEWDPGDRIMQL